MSVKQIAVDRHSDGRGWFVESWNKTRFASLGVDADFCQDNHSYSSAARTLRGLHFQRSPHAQAKLVRCLRGRIFDVAVDIRRESPTFRSWVGVELTSELGNQLYIPPGYAHGFLTLEPDCEVAYKVDAHYAPEADGGIAWDDSDLSIDWPLNGGAPIISEKDRRLPGLAGAKFNFPYDGNPLTLLNV